MTRQHIYPEGHWSLAVDIPYSMGVKEDDFIFLCGQADLVGDGEVNHPHDLYRQTSACIEHIQALFTELKSSMEKLVKLTVFYVNDGSVNQAAYLRFIADRLNTRNAPVVAMVPVTHLFYPGLMVEIDAVGLDTNHERVSISKPQFGSVTEGLSQALRCGEFIFIGSTHGLDTIDHDSGQPWGQDDIASETRATLQRVESLLACFGADRKDLVKVNNWFTAPGTAEQWAAGANARAAFFHEPGPVATGHTLHTVGYPGVHYTIDCWAMLGENGSCLEKTHAWPKGHWDWPVHLPFKHGLKCGNMIFIGGQVSLDNEGSVIDPGDLARQTHTSMENIGKVLGEFGADYRDIIKLNTWYVSRPGADNAKTLHENVNIRSSYFQKPGPASTGIPLESLCFEHMLNETEVIAICPD